MKTKINGTKNQHTFIFAHGAGAPMDSDWINDMTNRLVKLGLRVVRFEFPYMVERRETGKKRPPNTAKVLLETWRAVIKKEREKGHQIFIGGKSMGGRMASLIADEQEALGLICLGFPFHAPGKGPGTRIDHLEVLKTPTLIIQGTRDSMGTKDECKRYALSNNIYFEWLEDGDHSFKPRKKSGIKLDEHMDKAANSLFNFIMTQME